MRRRTEYEQNFNLEHHGHEVVWTNRMTPSDLIVAYVKKQTGIDMYQSYRLVAPDRQTMIELIAMTLRQKEPRE